MKKKKCLILINAYSPTATEQVARFCEEFERRGISVTVRNNDFFPLVISGGKLDMTGIDCDFCLYLDKDKYVAAMLEKAGVRLFDSADAISVCDDKMQTHIALCGRGIPMPDTVPGLLCYDKSAPLKKTALDAVERRLGYPVVVKQSYGSLGKGVFRADGRAELEAIAEKVKTEPHLFQKYIAASAGRDIRVIVIGGRAIGGMMRISDSDFRSNIGLGAHAQKVDLSADIADYAQKAASALGLDYCGIDFLLSPSPLLCEVNSNAFFAAFERATGINVAGAYADHILSVL